MNTTNKLMIYNSNKLLQNIMKILDIYIDFV